MAKGSFIIFTEVNFRILRSGWNCAADRQKNFTVTQCSCIMFMLQNQVFPVINRINAPVDRDRVRERK